MNDRGEKLLTVTLLGLAGYFAYLYYVESTVGESDSVTDPTASAVNTGVTNALQTLYENIVTSTGIMDWRQVGDGPEYMPTLSDTEARYGIPSGLLARIAYQESHFRPDIISGATRSPVGAVGIMQLMPQYFPGAGADPVSDIDTAGKYLAQLYNQFGDWQLAVAAYNDGPGNVTQFLNGDKTLPTETQNYIASVFADVPVPGSLIQVA